MKLLKLFTFIVLALQITPQTTQAGVPGTLGALVASSGSITIAVNPFIDSYNSAIGNYGRANVASNATAYAFETVHLNPAASFNGTIQGIADEVPHLANFPIPQNLLNSGDYSVPSGAARVLGSGDYLFDSFTLNQGSYLLVQAGVRVWVIGSINIHGEVANSTDKPNDFWIMGTENNSVIQITGSSTILSANIYAPSAQITVRGAEFYGSLTGASLDIQSGSSLHYDEATPALDPSLRLPAAASVTAQAPKIRVAKMQLGPVPSSMGEPICLFSPKPTNRTDWNIYNVAGERVATLDFGSQSSQCWTPSGLGAGVYLVQISANYFDGTSALETRKILVRN